GGCMRGLVGVLADTSRKAVAQRLLATEDAAGVGQFPKDIIACQRAHQYGPGHVGHEAPADLHDRELRCGMDVAHVGPEHRSEEHTSELQSRENLVCRLLLETKKN